MFDVVAANDDQLTLPIKVESVNDSQSLLPTAASQGAPGAIAHGPRQGDGKSADNNQGEQDAKENKRLFAKKRTQELHTNGPFAGANAT
jgi:hypothetical protein